MKGYYQPAGLVGWVNWAWIFMLALLALIMQLEVTKFNVWTAGFLLAFILSAWIVIRRRKLELVEENQIMHMRQLGSVHTMNMPITEMKYVQFTKRSILFSFEGENYNLWLSPRFYKKLRKVFEEA
ncbi:hypothetical protein WOSG25_130170 [Weissella oryzae SG25]|uniref:Pore-forming protein n=1 Tax=Weissella oryzae (strain DSM 25784 / JCM 18191 / LMG 30913 / SG25) TaxID=1329250 RepID=A0A069CV30_WEIOS|nr:EbsA family protein [Weissella oryzae]GAK31665.1 hypothetical protein WOSG25_130170 [Weissella oryzae SG25]